MNTSPTNRLRLHLLAAVFAVGLALPAAAAQAPAALQAGATEPFEGYVVSLDGTKLSASNVPVMMMGRPIQLGEDLIIRRGAPATAAGEEVKVEPGVTPPATGDPDAGSTTRVDPAADDKAKVDPPDDDKTKADPPQNSFVLKRNGAGEDGAGGGMTWTSDDAAGEVVPASEEPLQFLEFVITDETVRPDDIAPGQRIRVHFEERGDEKIATRIEVVESDSR